MGASRDDFTKYPRTPHLFGSRGTDDDKYLGARESLDFIADASLIVEEKLDGTNVGIHFTTAGRMVCRPDLPKWLTPCGARMQFSENYLSFLRSQ
jgi:hypothetical protein